ncbi:MAG TPA: iron uptake transporter deferrochelatase/peroxidase subunit [Devosiaceae bacterium]|nr:iron uptake transporter deferrochelatase/peroxidase subunit [Devosiaceae bacterium]
MPLFSRCPFPHHLFSSKDQPESPSRRALFKGTAAVGGAAALAGLAPHAFAAAASPEAVAIDASLETVPFYGARQAGIVNAAPAAGMVVSFDVLAGNRQQLSQLFQILTQRFAFLTQGGAAATADPAFPPPDSGILGPEVRPNRLTATLSVGASLFDDRFGLKHLKPRTLARMAAFPNDQLDADWCHGDLLIQFCSESADVNLHALRDIVKNTPALLMANWKQEGFLPQSPVRSEAELTPRNLLGFKDGTGNPEADDATLMERIVWVQAGQGEPAWCAGGSYQAVRLIRMLVEQWDRTPLIEQEKIIGRHKGTGAPLGMTHEHDMPDYASDPEGKVTPLDAHIRLANPRTAETRASLILRRPYSFSRGVSKSGQLEMGLLFTCFQADLEAGFITVQNRLNREPLEEYIKPIGGGYFFVLPGVPDKNRFLGQALIEAANA